MKKYYHLIGLLFGVFVSHAQTGIGTTTPVNKFQVESTTADPVNTGSSANGVLRLGGLSVAHVLDFGLSSTSTFAWVQARNKTYGTNYILALNPLGGNVGLGTSAPTTTLTVGNAAGTISGEITINPQGTTNEGGQITLKKSLSGGSSDWTIDQYATAASDARFRIFPGSTESNGITIRETGNIGIGTSTPSAKLNLSGGGIRIATGFTNSATRPAANTSSVGNYEIRGVGGVTQNDATDDGFLRLSAGGGTNATGQSSIDISGYSTVADMNNNIVMRTSSVERLRIDNNGQTTLSGNLTGTSGSSTIANFGSALNDQTGTTYTLTAADNGKILTFNNASAITLTVPSLSVGFNCMIVQKGTGQVNLAASGVTISNRYGYTKTAGQYAMLTLVCIASNVYISSGDMNN
ncbi:MAG: hypothetical protein ACKOXC_02435 [Aquirufa sp.]